MKLKKAATMLALAMGVAGAQFGASSALASAPDERELWEMLKKSSTTRADGMTVKDHKGTLSAEEIARILDPNIANP